MTLSATSQKMNSDSKVCIFYQNTPSGSPFTKLNWIWLQVPSSSNKLKNGSIMTTFCSTQSFPSTPVKFQFFINSTSLIYKIGKRLLACGNWMVLFQSHAASLNLWMKVWSTLLSIASKKQTLIKNWVRIWIILAKSKVKIMTKAPYCWLKKIKVHFVRLTILFSILTLQFLAMSVRKAPLKLTLRSIEIYKNTGHWDRWTLTQI